MPDGRLADGIAVLPNACVHQDAIYPGDGPPETHCSSLSACHTDRAVSDCRVARKSAGTVLGAFILGNTTRLAVRTTRPHAASVAHRRRGALFVAFGNPGHDFALQGGLLDLWAQAQLTGAYDELLVTTTPSTSSAKVRAADLQPAPLWAATLLSMLFNASRGGGQVFWLDPHKSTVNSVDTTAPAGWRCYDQLAVRTPHWQRDGLGWGNLARHVPSARARVRHALGLDSSSMRSAPRGEAASFGSAAASSRVPSAAASRDSAAAARVVIYSREDDKRRQLHTHTWQPEPLRRALGLAPSVELQLVRQIPARAMDQLRLFGAADVLITVHGAALASTIAMRAGSVVVELTPWCAELCTEGCRSDEPLLERALALPRREGCVLSLSGYAPLHMASGVAYHVLPLCVGGNRCHNGTTPPMPRSPHKAYRLSGTHYNWYANMELDEALVGRLRRLLRRVGIGNSAASSSLGGGGGSSTAPWPTASRVVSAAGKALAGTEDASLTPFELRPAARCEGPGGA